MKAVTDAAYRPYIARIGLRPMPMDRDHAADVAEGRVFVVGDPVTGVLVLVPHEDHLFVESVAVHPDAHGRGVGRRLLEFVDEHACELGLFEVQLYTNAMMWENRKLYPKFGYEAVERRAEGPYDRVRFCKRLAPPSGH